ncbi:MAG: hypothetical protein ACXVP1_08575 [Thermoleophilia bacterium]
MSERQHLPVTAHGFAGVGASRMQPEERLDDLAEAGAEIGELRHEVGHGGGPCSSE